MGKSAAEIESDLERQRRALSQRIARLEGRLRDDAGALLSTAGEDSRRLAGATVGTSAGRGTAVAEHPAALLSGAFAGGAVLGFATGGEEDVDRGSSSQVSDEERGAGFSLPSLPGIHPPGGIVGSIIEPIRAVMAAKLADFAQDVVGDLFGRAREAIERPASDGHEPAADVGILGSAWDNLPEHSPPHPAGPAWAPEEAGVH